VDRNTKAFLAIAKKENLSAAAEIIGLTQPSITKRLANLEEDLGTKLFERHRRGMELNAAGRLFLARALRIEHEYGQAKEEIRALKGMGMEVLRVGAGPLFHLRYVAPLFARIRDQFPALTFDLVADQNAVTLPMLRDGKIDVVLGPIEQLPPDALIAFIPVADMELFVLMAADDTTAQTPLLRPRDLDSFNWVAYGGATDNNPLLRRYCIEHKLSAPRIIAHSTSFAATLDLTRELKAKLLAPMQLAEYVEAVGLVARPIHPPIIQQAVGVHVRQSSLGIPVIRKFLEELTVLMG
jgi:DNA-binding transcriptional LysR family regulator